MTTTIPARPTTTTDGGPACHAPLPPVRTTTTEPRPPPSRPP
ncbi:hypothetical protein [Pseudonocardia humida]|nr:hypothetical protein [Pseudonocardia humida]